MCWTPGNRYSSNARKGRDRKGSGGEWGRALKAYEPRTPDAICGPQVGGLVEVVLERVAERMAVRTRKVRSHFLLADLSIPRNRKTHSHMLAVCMTGATRAPACPLKNSPLFLFPTYCANHHHNPTPKIRILSNARYPFAMHTRTHSMMKFQYLLLFTHFFFF